MGKKPKPKLPPPPPSIQASAEPMAKGEDDITNWLKKAFGREKTKTGASRFAKSSPGPGKELLG